MSNTRHPRTLIVDNFDSYTHNLFQLFWTETGHEPIVIHNDEEAKFQSLHAEGAFANIVVSPGPGRPDRAEDFGICKMILQNPPCPIFGVCLGCQGMGWLYGLEVNLSPGGPMHGRLSDVYHDGDAIFAGVPRPFSVVRYHSLALCAADQSELQFPPHLKKIAWTATGVVMGIKHTQLPLWGVQFHPESICTEYGAQLVRNFQRLSKEWYAATQRDADALDVPMGGAADMPHGAQQCPEEESAPRQPAKQAPRGEEGMEVVFRRVEADVDAEEVYYKLFSADARAFWLDSSRHDAGKAQFSFMGGSCGPLAYQLQYNVRTRSMAVARQGRPVEHVEDVDVLAFVKEQLARCAADAQALPFDFCGGFVGYLGYELKELCEDSAGRNRHSSPHPDASLLFADRVIAVDHDAHCCYAVALVNGETRVREAAATWLEATRRELLRAGGRSEEMDFVMELGADADAKADDSPVGPGSMSLPPVAPQAPEASMGPGDVPKGARLAGDAAPSDKAPVVSKGGGAARGGFAAAESSAEYRGKVEACLGSIRVGESYELCLTTHLRSRAGLAVDPLQWYRRLRASNPAPYAALLRCGEGLAVCSSSPERFLRIGRGGRVESRPIKGTRRRGGCAEEDANIREELERSEKDRAENLMIVDLVRNDLGRVCETGSVTCPQVMKVESYATVHQLVSAVQGRLRPGCSTVDCVRAAFPMGSMTGAPKRRSMQLLEELEGAARGIYSGSIGFLSVNGAADLSVAIRTAVVTEEGVAIGAGGAITMLSDPHEEWEEMLLKANAVIASVVAC